MWHRNSRIIFLYLMVCLTAFTESGCRTAARSAEDVPTGNVVKIAGKKGSWQLLLNGRPFTVKGVGVAYARGREGTDYLQLARDMGATTVRTWGTRHGTQDYLDRAYQQGLYVDAGIWLNPVYANGTCSYLTDERYKRQVRRETLDYVSRYKNHPALLFWNIGNETIYWTKNERERIGFCRFLEQLVRQVHAIDPHHPVAYTSAFSLDADYIRRYVPSVDIIGLNIYGGLEEAHRQVVTQMRIPYVVSEFGPLGPWDRPKDVNGKAVDLTDIEKADYYERYATLIEGYRGYCLGGFAFTLGESSQVSLTWWNLTAGRHPRLPFLTLQRLYTGEPAGDNQPPLLAGLEFSKQKALRPGETFDIRVEFREPEHEPVRFQYAASTTREDTLLDEDPNSALALIVQGDGAAVTATAPSEKGIYRIYALGLDPHGLAGVISGTIAVKAPAPTSADGAKSE